MCFFLYFFKLLAVQGSFIYLEDKIYQWFNRDVIDSTKLKRSYYSYTSDIIGDLTNTNFDLGFWMKYTHSGSKQILIQTDGIVITMLSNKLFTYQQSDANFIADHSISLNTGNWLFFSFQQEGTTHSIILTEPSKSQQNILISFIQVPTYFSFFETDITSFIGWLGQAEQLRLITRVNFQSRDYQRFISLSTLELRTLLFINFQEKVQTKLLKDSSSYDYEKFNSSQINQIKLAIMLGGSYNIRTDVDDPILDLTDQSFKFGSSKFLNISNFALPSSFNIELRLSLSDQSISNFAIFSLIQKAQPQLVIEYVGNGNLKISIDSEQFNVQLEITVPVLTIQLFFIKIYDDLNGSKLYGKFYQINDQGGISKSAENIFTSIDLSMKYAQHLLIGSPFNSIGSEFVKFYEVKVNQGAFFMEDTQIQNCKLFVGQRCVVCDNSYVVNHDGTCQSACPDNYIFSSYHNKCIRKCHNLCESCSDSDPTQCIVCAGNRINPPICECQQGFEDYVSPTCKKYIKDSSVQVGVVEFELTPSCSGCYYHKGDIYVYFQQSYKVAPNFIISLIGIENSSRDISLYTQIYSNYLFIQGYSYEKTKFKIQWMSGISKNFISSKQYYYSINTNNYAVSTYQSKNSLYLSLIQWELSSKSISNTFISANITKISYQNPDNHFHFIQYQIFEYANYQVLKQTDELKFDGDSRYQNYFGTSGIATSFDYDFPLSIDHIYFMKNYIADPYMNFTTISKINQFKKLEITRLEPGNPFNNWSENFTVFILATQCNEGVCNYFQSMIDQCNRYQSKCDRYFFFGSSMVLCNSNCYECDFPGYKCLSCISGQYLDIANTCQECDSNCQKCDTTSTHCIRCSSHQYLDIANTCQECDSNCQECDTTSTHCIRCSSHQYLDIANTCQECDSNCQECDTTSTHCIRCSSHQYLDIANTCQECDSNCQECDTTSTHCTDCQSHAQLTSSHTCVCDSSYYFQGYVCKQCNSNCKECDTTSTHCIRCSSHQYLDIANTCQECDSNCQECDTTSTHCIRCSSHQYLDIANTCQECDSNCQECDTTSTHCIRCSSHQYLDIANTCQECDSNCQECDTTSTHCIRCSSHQYLDIANTCQECDSNCQECDTTSTHCIRCSSHQYLDIANTCQECDSNCQECDTTSTHCTDCQSHAQLTSSHTCVCDSSYYFQGYVCKQCNSNCKECVTTSTNCTDCQSHARLSVDHTCVCDSSYYFQGNVCEQCNSNCKECDTTSTHCTDCQSHARLSVDHTCVCDSSYYFQENVCEQCSSNCQECVTTSTNCISCNSKFYLENNVCLNCSLQCFTCEFSSDNCTSCNSNASLNKIANSSISQCLCNQGYYMNLNQQCQICDEKCLECVDEATNCTQCNDTLYFDADQLCQYCDQTKCLSCELDPDNCLSCHSNFYLLDNNCVQCHKSCDSCSGPLITDCLTCLKNMTMTAEKKCVCSIGYFEIEPIGCDQCQETCKTCNKKTECIDCKEGLNRNLDLNYQCSCELGYYESGESLQCLKCLENCATCTNGQSCASCDSTKNRTLINGFCECKEKFFLNEISRECISCHSKEGMIYKV